MAKTKRTPNSTKSLATLQTAHSYTQQSQSDVVDPSLAFSAPSEDAGVCIVCEDECTCGAAAAAAKATTTSTTNTRRLVLTMPKKQSESSDLDSATIQFTDSSNALGSAKYNKKKNGRSSKAGELAKQAASRAARGLFPSPRRIAKKHKANAFSANLPLTPLPPAPASTFPLFVSASVFGSDSSLTSPSSDDDSSEDLSDDIDSDVEAEEERLIVEETLAMQKIRARRELLEEINPETNGGRRWDKMNWNHRERHGSVGADPLSDGDSDSDSGNTRDDEQDGPEEDDEDDDEDAEDAELDGLSGPAAFESSEEDEEGFDADIFFANLSDSSFDSSSSDSEPTAIHNDHNLATSLTEVAASTILMSENWDDQLIFHGLKESGEGILDLSFSALAQSPPSVDEDDFMDEADEDQTDAGTDDDYEAFSDIIAGDTTDEDELHPQLGSIVFANSPFNPKLTLNSSPKTRNRPLPSSSLNPSSSKNSRRAGPVATLRATPTLSISSSGSQASEANKLIPVMGSFTISNDFSTSAVIDGTRSEVLPSPYPRSERKLRPLGRKRRAKNQMEISSSRSPKRARQISQPRTPSPVGLESPKDGSAVSDLPPPEPIDLDDVLHAALLEDEYMSDENSDANPSSATGQVHRNRVPINAFRRFTTSGVLGSPASTNTVSMLTAGSPRPADGFSYGSTASASGALSPFAAHADASLAYTLWETNSPHASPRLASARSRRLVTDNAASRRGPTTMTVFESASTNRRGRSHKRKILVSPVILPVQEGDKRITGSPLKALKEAPMMLSLDG